MSQNDQFPDPLLTAIATAGSIAAAKEIEAYSLGLMAYVWGYPLVRMERVIRTYVDMSQRQALTSYRAPLNQIGWAKELATPAAKDMPTANNDTLYMSAVLTLTEPYVLSVPDTNDRYYTINIFSMYHELEHYIGRRTTGTRAGRYAIVPPGWEGQIPVGITPLHTTTDKVWLWGRLHVKPGEELIPVLRLQNGFSVCPLGELATTSANRHETNLPDLPDIAGDELGFFVHLGYAMQQNHLKEVDKALVGQLERIGLTKEGFDRSSLSPQQLDQMKRSLADGKTLASAAITTTATRKDGWDWIVLDEYGWNYPLRAVHSGPYLGGNTAKEALYPNTYVDEDGNPLSGAHAYEVRFSGKPPVDSFWSLTIYNADDKMLVDNAINRYKIGSDTPGLRVDADGSLIIPIQHSEPAGPHRQNWLPAPTGEFNLFLRFYQPREELLNGSYTLPQIVKVG